MIFPLATDPKSINTAMIRIADENNKDIDKMQAQVKDMYNQQTEMESRYKTQADRWERYRQSYEATLAAYHVQNGNITADRLIELLPWAQL